MYMYIYIFICMYVHLQLLGQNASKQSGPPNEASHSHAPPILHVPCPEQSPAICIYVYALNFKLISICEYMYIYRNP